MSRSGEQLSLFDSADWDSAPAAQPARPAPVPAATRPAEPSARPARSARRRGRGRRSRTVPFTYSVGVGAFGWLRWPTGATRLVETRLFDGHAGRERAVLIALDDGATLLAPADGSLLWDGREPEEASALVGMPPPEYKVFERFKRRLDPHHVERHRSTLWQLLFGTVQAHDLPCGYRLTAVAQDREAPAGVGLTDEDPEIWASAVCLRVAEGAAPFAAVLAELAQDAHLDEEPDRLEALLRRTGWSAVLPELAEQISHLPTRAAEAHGRVEEPA